MNQKRQHRKFTDEFKNDAVKIEALPLYKNISKTGLLEQWIEIDLSGRINP